MSQPFIGQIIQGGWNFAPRGYALCNGQQLSIAQNTALFSLLGTNFGGNGQTTFGIPNLQSRSMVHWGTGPGLSPIQLGQTGGAENTTLTVNQMPAHTHAASFNGSTSTLNASTTAGTTQAPAAGSVLGRAKDGAGTVAPLIYAPAGSNAAIALAGLNVAGTVSNVAAGGSQPFSIRDPYQAVTHVIALQGIFPSRN